MVAVLASAAAWLYWHKAARMTSPTPDSRARGNFLAATQAKDAAAFALYAGSASCRECHPQAYLAWQGSHHALAERNLDPAQDQVAFDPPRTFQHGEQTSTAQQVGGRFALATRGLDGQVKPYHVERVLGVNPLRQFLVPQGAGRYQVTELAFDPARKDWFDVYGLEDRQPGEWGHWSGRGMNWNSMCAGCHNTRLRKNYDEVADAYHTTRAEMGVGCEACHGPLAAHVTWQRAHPNGPPRVRPKDPALRPLDKDRMLAVCGSCHARRVDLTGEFHPGDLFLDHFSPVIPDETDTYFPDGQVRDEDFEYVSFLGSRMYSLGVRCIDCHEPHSGKTRATGNDLCLRCHKATIDPLAHGHHALDKAGGRCVDCHMPITVYMARHPRRDHGLTIPDPQLTRDYGVPNACNRCHRDRSVDWCATAVTQWFGDRMARHTQDRARWLARARAGDQSVAEKLIQMAREEPIPLWRGIAVSMVKRWEHDDRVRAALLESTRDPAALVRGAAARALEPLMAAAQPTVESSLQRLLTDPVRTVRIEAAWALRGKLDTNSIAGADLANQLKHNLDQPTGSLQMGVFLLDRGQTQSALNYFRRAVAWDAKSPALRQAFAVALSSLGQTDEAIRELETACQLAPRDADLQFNRGLALGEAGRLDEAARALEKAVALDPAFGRAWYNLGLARSSLGEPDLALAALVRAETNDVKSADAPFARATILQRLGRLAEAGRAARRALEIDPHRADAAALLEALDSAR
jgi:predicted CXXCH cytochrome family protein